jgi:hypothetical protein
MVDELRRWGQVIVYMVHEQVGHLGIFVSSRVARKGHREIIGCMEMLDYLAPGLYEMVIEGEPSHPWIDDYTVRFEQRDMANILRLDDGLNGYRDMRDRGQEACFKTLFGNTLVRQVCAPCKVVTGDTGAIACLLPTRKERLDALAIAQRVDRFGRDLKPSERWMIERIEAAPGL